MNTIKSTNKKKLIPLNSRNLIREEKLIWLAFNNSIQPNIITSLGSGQIIMANRAACKLLAYSKKELLLKNWSAIFETNELSFKKMQKQVKAAGKSVAVVTAIKKNGNPFSCEITTAVFANDQGIHKSVTTISDLSHAILEQKIIDTLKEKIVADNIVTAHSKQISIDKKKAKLVAGDIILAKAVADKIVKL